MDDGNSGDRPLSFYFFCGAISTILLIETIMWILINQGAETFLYDIRSQVYDRISQFTNVSPEHILPAEAITKNVLYSSRLLVLLNMTSLTIIVVGFLLILRHWVFSPIELILEKDKVSEEGQPELIAPENIPRNEIGLLIRSRNNLLQTMDQIFSEEAIETLVQAVEAKDPYTQGHSRRVGEFGALIGEEIGLSELKINKLKYSGTLHDLGKIGISDQILTKPDKLTDEEYEKVKEHPEKGVQIIQFGVFDEEILNGIKHHHERYEGNGYPDQLEAEEIPLFGRILAVADAVDAMLSDREYRDGLPLEVVREELGTNKGSQFDPELADVGLQLLRPENQDRLPTLFQQAVEKEFTET